MSPKRYILLSIFYALYGLGELGLFGAIKIFLARFSRKLWCVQPKGVRFPIELRGQTSDPKLIYDIFLCEEYGLDSAHPTLIIDAGANVGTAAVYFTNKRRIARIISIEPEGSNFEQLRKNTRNYEQIECIQAGVWSRDCQLRIKDSTKEKWGFEVEEVENGPIRAMSIPGILENNWKEGDSVLVKIDVEGADQEIFKGDTSWLSKVDYLFIEVHGSWKALFKALEPYDYEVALNRENLLISLKH